MSGNSSKAGNVAIDHDLSRITSTHTMHNDSVVPYLKNLTEAIHMYGAKTFMEIVHGGRQGAETKSTERT